jgi:TonB family protein
MLFMLLVAAAGSAPVTHPSAINPGSWFTAFSYPPEAEKNRVEGTVGFEVDVDATGKPSACRITSSSGSPLLDQPTCAMIMAKARFHPARDANGAAVAGQYDNKTVWQLHVDKGPRWTVAIVDLSDPKHPSCSEETHGGSLIALNCAHALPAFAAVADHSKVLSKVAYWNHESATAVADASKTMTKIAYFSSMAFGDDAPYDGNPAWGTRMSYSIVDQYTLNGMEDCEIIALKTQDSSKALNVNPEPCSGFRRTRRLKASLKPRAVKIRYETAVFAIPRKPDNKASNQGTSR